MRSPASAPPCSGRSATHQPSSRTGCSAAARHTLCEELWSEPCHDGRLERVASKDPTTASPERDVQRARRRLHREHSTSRTCIKFPPPDEQPRTAYACKWGQRISRSIWDCANFGIPTGGGIHEHARAHTHATRDSTATHCMAPALGRPHTVQLYHSAQAWQQSWRAHPRYGRERQHARDMQHVPRSALAVHRVLVARRCPKHASEVSVRRNRVHTLCSHSCAGHESRRNLLRHHESP